MGGDHDAVKNSRFHDVNFVNHRKQSGWRAQTSHAMIAGMIGRYSRDRALEDDVATAAAKRSLPAASGFLLGARN